MTANEQPAGPAPPSRLGARLRMTGIVVLILGIAGAGLVYWLGTRSDSGQDLSLTGFDRSRQRQMEIFYGKMGTLINDWSNDLKQPGTQAVLIAGVSVLVAYGCFHFARLMERNDKTD